MLHFIHGNWFVCGTATTHFTVRKVGLLLVSECMSLFGSLVTADETLVVLFGS